MTDPEQFLGNPSYPMSATASNERHRPDSAPLKVLIIEDAGEFPAADPKRQRGTL